MKRFILKYGITAAAAMVFGINCIAAPVAYDITTDYANNTITVKGTAAVDGRFMVLQVLNKDCTFEQVKTDQTNKNLIFFRDQTEVKDGEYSFTIEYPDTVQPDGYAGRLTTNGNEEETDIVLPIVSDGDYEATVGEVNRLANAGNYDNFKAYVETNSDSLGLDMTLYNQVNDELALKPFMESVKVSALNHTQSDKNTKLFNSAVLMSAITEGNVDNIENYINGTSLVETAVYEDYRKLADTEEKQKYITQKIKKASTQSIADFENSLKKALVLEEIRYANGYGEVQSILAKYGQTVGITGGASTNVYKEMAGEDYDEETIAPAFEELKKKYGSGDGNGGLGGGSGSGSGGGIGIGSGSGNSGGSSMNGGYNEGITQKTEKTDLLFHDIDSVQWAVEAIYALADKKIINGKADGYFNPDDYVTREEFAKMLVGALGYGEESYGKNVFSDVGSNDWFIDYVNIAYNKGIIKGVGDGRFGTGEMITRQDMAVMLYNSMLHKGAAVKAPQMSFSDSERIADYAKTAVGVLFAEGIVNGVSETEFAPLETATRAQAAKIIYGALKYF